MITRDNYEEFFLLHLDGELSAAERQIVEKFVADNPDLQDEWESLQQCRLDPESQLVFNDKESLYRDHSTINEGNYEAYFLSLIDGELDDEARKAVADYTNHHPDRLQELMLLQHTVSVPDETIIFERKEVLYRRTKDTRIFALPWLRVAAAAVLILGIGILLLTVGKDRKKPAIAYNSKSHPTEASSPSQNGQTNVQEKNDSGLVTPMTPTTLNKGQQAGATAVTETQDRTRPSSEKINPTSVTQDRTSTARVTPDRKTSETKDKVQSLQEKTNGQDNPEIAANDSKKNNIAGIPDGVAKKTISPGQIAAIDTKTANNAFNKDLVQKDQPAPIPQGTISRQNSSFASQALLNEANNTQENDIVLEESASPKKNKLRGIFRRVSRVFEKTTNVDEEKHGILIGNFQVALK